jgi:lysophospholipase L1-like esterase
MSNRLVPSLRSRAAVACLAATLLAAPPALAAAPGDGWIPSWAASPQPVWAPDFPVPLPMPRALSNQTIRQVARISLGGHRVRVEFSNLYGTEPLVIGAAHVALAGSEGSIQNGSDRALTFGGASAVTVPPGAPVLSDPVDLDVPSLGSLAVSAYFPRVAPTTTFHNDGRQTAFISASGDQTGAAAITPATTTHARIFLSRILVDAQPGDRAVVLYGDSITDGDGSTVDANHRWPDLLAERLHARGIRLATINEGISGDRVLSDRLGDNALARFDRDVLDQPHADTLVLMMGINDIGWPGCLLGRPNEPEPSADDIVAGYKQLIARAHAHGMRIVGATLTPFHDAFDGTPFVGYWTPAKEQERQAVNRFIRSGAFDGVIDFDRVVQDPNAPDRIRPEFDHGDHLHPNDKGYAAMADAVDLSLLGVK